MNTSEQKIVPLRSAAASDNQRAKSLPTPLLSLQGRAKLKLLELLAGVFNNIDDNLFELASRADNNGDQNLYFESMREVRMQRRGIELNFGKAISHSVAEVVNEAPRVAVEASADSLSLLEHHELEQIVALDGMVAKSLGECNNELMLLTARCDALLTDRQLSFEDNPLSPKVLGKAFVDACDNLDIDIKSKLMLFKLFDKQVFGKLQPFYQQCNAQLEGDGILPNLVLADAYRAINPDAEESLLGADSLTQQPPQDDGVSLDQMDVFGAEQESSPVDLPEQDVFRSVQQLMTQLQRFSATDTQAKLAPRTRAVSRDQVVSALSEIQAKSAQLPVDDLGYVAVAPSHNDLKMASEQLVKQLTEASGGQSRRIGQLDEDAINLVEMLFGYILDDKNLSTAMKALIARLQIPLIKVAMLDKELFNSSQHPARLLLNELAANALGWNRAKGAQRDKLYSKIEQIVDQITTEFDDDISLFQQLLVDLIAFNESEDRRARLVEQRTLTAEQGRAKSENARRQVERQLVERIQRAESGGHELPVVVTRFLGQAWSDVLFLICLREGVEGEQWRRAMKLVDNLLWSVSPLKTSEQRQRLLKVMPTLLRSLRSGLQQIGHSEFDTTELFEQLEALHMANVRGELHAVANEYKQQAEQQSVAPTSLDEALAGGADAGASEGEDFCADEDILEMVDSMVAGSWVEVSDNDEQQLRARLAAIIKSTERYIFVNRAGVKVADWLRGELAAEVEKGHVKLLESGLLFDRALESVINNLREMKDQRRR
ncbi:hypothetical protein SIN8267_01463 [Sinobacterium norvegicum]|uniref:Thymidine phosphorylase n=1 Tax=Sinobacterium norvegicum TaxID=1641715 RepID=A0ABN8EI53_9GAMM|nr:DUF1631 domain-containing protein [Sinobacterium norvegicum]CAH0991360.1 hypothetical protein SIN8267_01463 [Sinobacterium norvegicum]